MTDTNHESQFEVDCARCEGDGWVEVFDDEGWPVGGRNCDRCNGTGKVAADA